ncbi:DUF4215 domain-containing protein [Candidatus Peregrinibacteria bacterium]|nr:DUF4215 domain-containing protein [Candidatus Peregrinibacteria bacterium]
MKFKKWMLAVPLAGTLFVQTALADTQANYDTLVTHINNAWTQLAYSSQSTTYVAGVLDAQQTKVTNCVNMGHSQKDNQSKIDKAHALLAKLRMYLSIAQNHIKEADNDRFAANFQLGQGNNTAAQTWITSGEDNITKANAKMMQADDLEVEILAILNGMVFPADNCAGGGGGSSSSSSAPSETCGDEEVQGSDEGDETCDEGAVDTATCDADCTAAVCGDTYVNGELLETCDDGNTSDGDYCSSDCTDATGSCGDETVQEDIENCDEGAVDTATCNSDCTSSFCGDGHSNAEAGEECDDGNTEDNDGCSSSCVIEE